MITTPLPPIDLAGKQLILASKSPRRRELLSGLGIPYVLETREVDESFPDHLVAGDIAMYLSGKKADAFLPHLRPGDIVITADTIVWINHHVLNKPESREEAFAMLGELSGNTHEVFTAVTIMSDHKRESFVDRTEVTFAELTEKEINFYIDTYKPYDKAGAYGVQEFIGYMGITHLSGSYYNVMGLPVQKVYDCLKRWGG
ncbi:MAG: hypothetical protein RL220_1036 [Bacteroidota bacterium]